MILTTKGRYAINAILEMMSANEKGGPVSLAKISEKQNISVAYLEQIFSNLKKADLVESIKGPGGGYVLKNAKITANDIVKATGEKIKMTSCANENNCVKFEENNNKCKTHHIWKGLERTIQNYFSSIDIKDLAKDQSIYFDNNATTQIDFKVLEEMNLVQQRPLNSSSAHHFGHEAVKYINKSKTQIVDLLKAQNYQIIFTSSATESNNMALHGFDNFKIITSKGEHASIYQTAQKLDTEFVRSDANGEIDLADLEETIKNLNSKNFLVSIILANNETGTIQNIKEIAKITHQYGGLIHSDITQAASKIKVDLEYLNVDLASISSHKVKGPQGVGALLVRNGLQINPLMYGGLQEDGKRPGTANIAGIVGFGKAFEIAQENLEKYQEIAKLRDYLESKLVEIAGNDVQIFGKNSKRLANTSFFATKNLSNQTLMIALDLKQIAVSIGSACSSGVSKSSHVLKDMGVDEKTASCAIRISLSNQNTKSEIDKFIKIWQELYLKNKND